MMMIKLNKNQLDLLGTIFGAIAGICAVLVTQEVGDAKTVGTIGGVATVLLGVVTQRPANAAPTTEDIEEQNQ
ncbi:hypothetical protein [Synechocystis sp. PCC 7509]|uniref:hypothetical protein n=1 Tax=Synechocystis sp. PCC 7509 TaxID=927677 RepID=UPI0002ACF2E0|nr:hypothetical protein [Synechocystis sp. PCC 7509]